MRVWELDSGFGIDNVREATRPEPRPGAGEAVVEVGAASLNYRDHLLVAGIYQPRQRLPVILLSDAAGIVVEVGPGVSRVKAGDRVVASFFPGWEGGALSSEALMSALAYPGDGVLAERRTFAAAGLFPIPPHLSCVEATALPCAGLTAWSAIVGLGRVKPGDLVLVQGTGGVALFALQFAKAAGATVIVTSSSDEKLERARALGADYGINYRSTPEWGKAAQAWAGGRALDHIVELGGGDTLERSLHAIKPGGTLSLIGVLGGPMPTLNLPLVVMRQVRLQGVTVGSNQDFAAMLRAIASQRIRPVTDNVFAFADTRAAFQRMASGQAFGKIVIDLAAASAGIMRHDLTRPNVR